MGRKRGERGPGPLSRFFKVGLIVSGVLVVYVLSAGPAMRCWPAPVMSRSGVVGLFYSPVVRFWLGTGSGRQVFDWYFKDVWKVRLAGK